MNHSITRINYNRMSRWYDWLASSEKQFTGIGIQMLKVQAGEKVLEIGFGTGRELVTLAHSVTETGKVYGIDISNGMFRIANKKFIRAGVSDWVDLRLGDAVKLPFNNAFFDAIFISFTLELFDTPEISIVLGECRRVLIENGRLGLVALNKQDIPAVKIYEWFHALVPSIIDCRPIPVRKWIESAGFIPVDTMEKAIWGLPVEMIIARKHD